MRIIDRRLIDRHYTKRLTDILVAPGDPGLIADVASVRISDLAVPFEATD